MRKLESERLILRDWQEEDANDYLEIYKDPEVEHAGAEMCNDYNKSIEIIRELIKYQESWAIVLKENHKVIGSIFLSDINRHHRYREMEFVISKYYHNKGFATEAVKQVLKCAFNDLDLLIVSISHHSDNLKSKRVIEKCRFTYEGTLRKRARNLKDSVFYSMTKEEWEKLYYE